MEITLVLIILTVAIVLFATEWVRMDQVSLLILLTLGLTGLVTAEEAFAGFSNPAVITVAAMFIISSGLANTGALGPIGSKLIHFADHSETKMIVSVMTASAIFSAFVNNIGATAMLMPMVATMARKTRTSPSKLLIPLAFGSLLGGVCTLIGTPPNILMNALMEQHTGETFGVFDFTPVGILLLAAGILYMALAGSRLLPHRKSGTLTEAYQVKEYITEVAIVEGSPLAGMSIAQSELEEDFNLKVKGILRGRMPIRFPRGTRKLKEGDILLLQGNPEGILKVRQKKGLEAIPERDNPEYSDAKKDDLVVVEASLTPTSEMVGKNLRQVRFAHAYGLIVLAIWRSGAPISKKVDQVKLQFGDVLLMQGPEEKVIHLGMHHGFLLLGGVTQATFRPRRGPLALLTLLGVVLLAATGVLPIMLSATLGALIMVFIGCLTPKEAYESIDWSIIVLIAGTLPLGVAMERSGAARLLADGLIQGLGPWGPWAVLGGMFFITFVLTGIMSNAATSVLIAPIAFTAALDLGVDHKPFFMAVAIAASSSFMTPISHQSNALVMGPGGYKFTDYTKVGAPLNILVWILATFLIPLVFPF